MAQDLIKINQWFRHVGEIILKLRWFLIIGFIVTDGVAFIGIQRIQIDVSYQSWFLDNDPLTIATKEFEKTFGNDEYVAILVEADDVFAPDILRMIRDLGKELKENVPFAKEVVSLTDLEFTSGTEEGVEIREIVPEEIPTDPAAIEEIRKLAFSKKFLVNRLFSDDSKQAWITLRLSPYPEEWEKTLEIVPSQIVGRKVLEIVNQEKYKPYNLKTAGMPPVSCEEQDFFSHEANNMMGIAVVIGVCVLFAFLRSLRGIVIPMITAASAVMWTFGTMGYLGITVDNMIMTVPIVVGMAVSITYSIHIFNFFERQFSPTGNRRESVLYAVEETGWPIFFTAATTVCGLISCYFVPIRQTRWMGLSSAAVVFATYVMVMILTPVLLSFGKNRGPRPDYQKPLDFWLDHRFIRFSRWIQPRSTLIMIIFVLIVLLLAGGLTRVSVSMNLIKNVGLKIPYANKMYYVGHTKIGSMNSYNVTLRFNQPNSVKNPETLKNFDLFVSEVAQLPLVKRVSSLLDIIKDLNQIMQSDDPMYYRIPDDQALIAQLLLLYEIANGTEQENWVDYEYTTLRLMVETSDFDSAEILSQFRYIEKRAKDLFPDAKFGMIGEAVQVSVAQNYIVKGELVSSFISLFTIGLLMMMVFQSVQTGLIGMIPNVAPMIGVGGLMGYLDIPMDMTTMMIIPMLLGLAVDDTIHFINQCKLEFQKTGNYQESIEITFRTVGKTIFMTSFILGVTFLVYLTSIAKFFINLSILSISGIFSALLADYFITPILVKLSKPYGSPKTLAPDQKAIDSVS
jgi:predicted RND superfamily exporter protein